MKNLRTYSAGILLLHLFFFAHIAFSQSKTGEMLNEYMNAQHLRMGFNGLIAVAKNDTIIYQGAIGYASHELHVPLQIGSKLQIASITKQFTAVLIALAVEEGKINFDDKLVNYFPQADATGWKDITIHHLLSHTSGLPHWKGIPDFGMVKSRLSLSQEQVLDAIFKMELLFTPGSNAEYSSPAYFLLATILENVYGETYAHLLKRKILQPLQMSGSGVYDQYSIIDGMASGYHQVSDDSLVVAPYRDVSGMKGSGNVYACASDLFTWNRSFLSRSIWSPSMKKTIFTNQSGKEIKNNAAYGYGWYLRDKTNTTPHAYFHGGGTFGFSSLSAIYPDEQISILILSNVSFLPVDQLWEDVEKIVWGKPFTMPQAITTHSISSDRLEKFTGEYVSTPGKKKLLIRQTGERLLAQLEGNPPFEMYAQGKNAFFGKKVSIQFTFELDEAGKVKGMKAEGRGNHYYFEKP